MHTALHFLLGTWIICYTSFPMWTKGDKTDPTFNYFLMTKKDGTEYLYDQVNYTKKNKPHSIKGYDYPDKKDNSAFVWRGKGILRPLKSKWKVVLKDQWGQWALIYFSKTVFTPAGVDIISRTGSLQQHSLDQIKAFMAHDSVLKKYIPELKQLK